MTFWFDRVPGVLLWLLLLTPLAYMPLSNAEPFKVPEEAAIVTLAWVFVFATQLIRAAAGQIPFRIFVSSRCGWGLAGLLAWVGVNSMLGVSPASQWAYAGTLASYLALGLSLVEWMNDAPAVRRWWVIWGLTAVVGFQCLSAWLQLHHFDFQGWCQWLQPGGYLAGYGAVIGATTAAGSPIGTLGNPNYLGEFLAVSWPVLVGAALTVEKLESKLTALVLLILPIQILILTSCRAAFVGLVLFAPVAALLTFGLGALNPRRWMATQVGKIATGAVLAGLVALFAIAGGPLIHKLNVHSSNALDLESRTVNWRAATAMWLDHPVTGVGLGGFKQLDVVKLAQLYPDGMPSSAASARFYEAHNEPIQTLAELGVVGMLLIVFALAMWVRETRRNASLPVTLRFGIFWSVGAVFFASCFGFPFHIPMTALAFTLVLALGLGRSDEKFVLVDHGMPKVPALAGLVAIALLSYAVVAYDAIPLNRAYEEQYQAGQMKDRAQYDGADALFRESLQDNRFKGTVLTQALLMLWAAHRYEDMVALYDTYEKQGAGMDALTMKGDALTELGKRDEAIAAYNRVIHYYSADHPNYQRAKNQLVRLGAAKPKT